MLQTADAVQHPTAVARTMTLLIGGALAVASASVAAASGGAASVSWSSPDMLQTIAMGTNQISRVIGLGFERQPAAMLAIAGATAIPAVAILTALVRGARRLMARHADDATTASNTGNSKLSANGKAWIEIEDNNGKPLPIGELMRIGQSDDCDVALGDPGIDHMHALIRRTPDCEFIIIDISANGSTGVTVNGRRSRQRLLHDGDRIEFGSTYVVFRQALVAGDHSLALAT